MSIPRRTRVILGGEGGGPRREFCLSRPVALLLGVLVLGVVVGAVLLAMGLFDTRGQRAAIAELERQLAEARTEAMTARILKAELEQSRRLQDELMAMLGLARTDSLGNVLADSICDVPMGLVPAGAAPDAATGAAAGAAAPATPPAQPGQAPSRWPAAGTVIREFTRGDPAHGVEAHVGIDIGGQEGSRVVAAAEGDVDFVGEDEVFGKYVEIRHGDDWVTVYGHCASINVGPGHHVRVGEQVAKMGRTGRTETAQLHFQVWQRGEAVDPRKLLSGEPAPR
jgi:murein DD-endopeptidase MepM/ murein hydrolase activator NlpD